MLGYDVARDDERLADERSATAGDESPDSGVVEVVGEHEVSDVLVSGDVEYAGYYLERVYPETFV